MTLAFCEKAIDFFDNSQWFLNKYQYIWHYLYELLSKYCSYMWFQLTGEGLSGEKGKSLSQYLYAIIWQVAAIWWLGNQPFYSLAPRGDQSFREAWSDQSNMEALENSGKYATDPGNDRVKPFTLCPTWSDQVRCEITCILAVDHITWIILLGCPETNWPWDLSML